METYEDIETFLSNIDDFEKITKASQIDYIAYFILTKKPSFSPKDIKQIFNLLNLPQYSNISGYLRKNTGKKFVVKGKDCYAITRQFQKDLDLLFNNQKTLPKPSDNLFPQELLNNTRQYIESVGNQAIICFDVGLYDACAVMIRKLFETLIIEAFERYKIADKIKNSAGNFYYLSELIPLLLAEGSWNISRNAQTGFAPIKKSGDMSAHNRRYCATQQDILDLKQDIRICLEELIKLIDYPSWNKELSKKK